MDEIETLILQLTAARGVEKSICPSEVARALGADWQRHMKDVRAASVRLARAGRVEILRKGKKITDLDSVRGVIRLRAAR